MIKTTKRTRKPAPKLTAEEVMVARHAEMVARVNSGPVGGFRLYNVGDRQVSVERVTATTFWWPAPMPGRAHGGMVDAARAADLILGIGMARAQADRLVRRSRGSVGPTEAHEAVVRCREATRDWLAGRGAFLATWQEARRCRNGVVDLKKNAGWMFAFYGPRANDWPGGLWFYGRNGVEPRGFTMARAA